MESSDKVDGKVAPGLRRDGRGRGGSGGPKSHLRGFHRKKLVSVSLLTLLISSETLIVLKWNFKIILQNVFSGGLPCQIRPKIAILGNFLQFCSQKQVSKPADN